MHRFWSSLAVWLGRRAGLVSVIGLLITLILGFGITQLEFQTGQDSYLNQDDQVYIDNVEYQDRFGGQAMLTVIAMDEGHQVHELFDAEGRAAFEQVASELESSGAVQGVITPLTALEFSDALVSSPDGDLTKSIAGRSLLGALEDAGASGDTESAAARTADSAQTLARAAAVPPDQRTLDNPAWIDFLLYDNEGNVRKALTPFFADVTHAQMIARLHGNLSIDVEGEEAAAVEAAAEALEFPNATTVTAGAPVLLRDLNDYLRGGMLSLSGIAVAIMVLILLLLFDVRWRLLPLAVVAFGILWAFGLAGYLGIPLTIVTIGGLPVMLGVGIDYAIQMHARVEEEVIIDRSRAPIQETARKLCPALLVVTFDAVFAFMALRFAKVPMIRDFGLLLAVGIAVICLASIIIPLATLGIREFRSPTKGRDFREGPLGRLVVWLGSLPGSWAVPLAVISLAIFLGGVWAEDKLVIQTDPVEWVNQSSQIIEDLEVVEREIGGSAELGVFVHSTDDGGTDMFRQPVVDFMDTLEREFAADERIVFGSSLVTTLRDLMYVPGAADVTPQAELVREAFEVAPEGVKAATVSEDGSAFNIVYLTGPGSLTERSVVVRDIERFVEATDAPPGIAATPSGLAVVGVGLLENLEANRILLTYLAMAFVGIFLSFRLRSVVRALLSLVPVSIAVGVASLVAWAFSLTLSPMTAVGGPLIVAVCTEFTSLILLRFIEERDRGLEPRPAVNVAARRTGRAFIVSALTAISGVAVLSLSSLPLLRDFGRIVAMNVAVALASALVILPPLMVWADAPQRRWVSKGMLGRHPEDYVETSYEPEPRAPEPA